MKAWVLAGLAALSVQDDAWTIAKKALDKAFDSTGQSSERAEAVRGLGRATTAESEKKTAEAVVRALADELGQSDEVKVHADVLSACVDVLGAMRGDETVDYLIDQANRGGQWRKRYYIIKALGLVPGEKVTQALKDLVYVGKGDVRENDPHIVNAALDALSARNSKEGLETYYRALSDPNLPWDARLAALNGIARAADPASVDKLIESLGTISDAQARLKVNVIEALRRMTGLDLQTGDPEAWKKAWKDKAVGKDDGLTRVQPIRPTTFFGLKSESSRIVFVLDKSLSMREPASDVQEELPPPPVPEETIGTGNGTKGRMKPKDPLDPKRELDPSEVQAYEAVKGIYERWRASSPKTRMELMKKEFIKTLFWLDHRVMFALFLYDSKVTPITPEMIVASWANKLWIMQEVEKIEPKGWTNIGDALFDHAMQMISPRGPGGKYDGVPVIKTHSSKGHIETVAGPDTIYLLTDGEPNAGRLSPYPDPETKNPGNAGLPAVQDETKRNITNELKKVLDVRKLKLHTITIGDRGSSGLPTDRIDPAWMKELAEMTGGSAVHVTGKGK